MRPSSCLIVVLVLSFVFNSIFANQIFTPHAGGTFGRSSHEPKYKIEFHSAHTPFHPDVQQESMVMTDSKGQKFLCFLPAVEKIKTEISVAQHNISSMIVETERPLKLKTPDELLELLKEKCLYRQEGWWSYEFCYQKKLRQLHLEGDKVVQEFVLGEYDADATASFHRNVSDVSILKDPRSKDASQRYHAHLYTNGTSCDLTNQPRETEVRFVCSDPRVMISSITELSTCKYALTVQIPMLCKHPMFKEERPIWHSINCNELLKATEQTEMEEGSFKDEQITMITDGELASSTD